MGFFLIFVFDTATPSKVSWMILDCALTSAGTASKKHAEMQLAVTTDRNHPPI
jgi:hypothetical protein